jgi:hypothetical protein
MPYGCGGCMPYGCGGCGWGFGGGCCDYGCGGGYCGGYDRGCDRPRRNCPTTPTPPIGGGGGGNTALNYFSPF